MSFLTLLYVYNQCTQVIYGMRGSCVETITYKIDDYSESVQIIAFYGIQLETARGIRIPFFPPVSLMSRKRFIALPYIRDIVINEGLWGWNVRYYLCVIKDTQKDLTLEVVFEVCFFDIFVSFRTELNLDLCAESSSKVTCTRDSL